jgi:uncharacterized protein (DUF4213/DUF364 family)
MEVFIDREIVDAIMDDATVLLKDHKAKDVSVSMAYTLGYICSGNGAMRDTLFQAFQMGFEQE